jgi:hypothetical protein
MVMAGPGRAESERAYSVYPATRIILATTQGGSYPAVLFHSIPFHPIPCPIGYLPYQQIYY